MAIKRFPVEEGSILLFARAIGDPNPIYSDSAFAVSTEVGGIIAPPTFTQSGVQFDQDYALRPKPGEAWLGSGRNPTGRPANEGDSTTTQGTVLHAEQHFEYRRPLRPGDVLSSSTREGECWEKHGRSGRLVFREYISEFTDQHGEVVVIARAVGVSTEGAVAKRDE